jgi:hypothetical protein
MIGKLAPGQRVITTYRYDGTYHFDLSKGYTPHVLVQLKVPAPDGGGAAYDSGQIPATYTSTPPDPVTGNGTWSYDSTVPPAGQGLAQIQAWLFDGATQIDTKSVSGFYVRNMPPPPTATPREVPETVRTAEGAETGPPGHTNG